MTRRILSLVLTLCMILTLTSLPMGAAVAEEPIVLKLGHINPETGNYHQYALAFKEAVETRSNGRLKIEIYPAGQLGYDRELLESIQFGNLDLGIITSSPIANFVPAFMALDFPFLFDSWDHVLKFIQSDACKELMNEGAADGLVGLGMLARGFRSTTNSRHPIQTSADFAGLKMRVIESPIYIKTFEALGATVSAMSWGEVFTALQQGTIEAIELDYRTLYDERVYEVQKYLSATEHIFAFATMMTNPAVLDSLPEDLRQILTDCAMETGISTSQAQVDIINSYIQKLQDAGIQYNECDREELRSKVTSVRDWFTSTYGDKYLLAIEACK
ncbi:MAG: TRAP transporter substrate-binding protein [Candidatus Limiplasma sp.]|nr:TRAP transporter substrate-binding protein [Candidatus Limiplasma sp.]